MARSRSSARSTIALVVLVIVLVRLVWAVIDLVARALVWLLLQACSIVEACAAAPRARSDRECAIIRRRLTPASETAIAVIRAKQGPPLRLRTAAEQVNLESPVHADLREVEQIMRQLGRRDTATRQLAEHILATGSRRPLGEEQRAN